MDLHPYKQITKNIYRIETDLLEKVKINKCDCTDGCSDNECANRQMQVECRYCVDKKCCNQRFRKNKYAKTAVYDTGSKKGFGLRALEKIEKGTFIIEYQGEIIDHKEYNSRKENYLKNPNNKHIYVFELGKYYIDATEYGNVSRYINHSCKPNAASFKWAIPTEPEDIPRIGVFAIRDIKLGEEITFSYNFAEFSTSQECFCGSRNCKGKFAQGDENQ